MRATLRIWMSVVGVCMLSAGVWAEETASPPVAFYEGLEPGAFMKHWLICGSFPVFDGEENPYDSAAQRQAFDRDFLADHGGETGIVPTVDMVHEWKGKEYRWQKVESFTDVVNLLRHCGRHEYVTAYAWARIDMPAETEAMLGIGSDDAVKIWLNGELVHENWTDRPAQPDDDLVAVKFRSSENHLLLKIQNGNTLWGFACRRLDPATLGDKLFTAVGKGDVKAVQVALSYGAQVNATDKYGFTPLQTARMRGQKEIAELLLAQGADPNIPMPETGTPVGFLDLLWKSLKDNYPMMEYAGAFDESWHDACKERIQDMNSLYEALPVMDVMLVQRLNDYHTGMYWDGKRGLVGPAIRAGWIEDRVVVMQCDPDSGISMGDVVLTIDDTNACECFRHQWPEAFGATTYARAESACRTIFEGEPGSKISLKLSDRSGNVYEKVLTRGEGGFGGSREPMISSRAIDDRTGYIRIRGWGGFTPGEFDELLDPLREKPRLIVDVRNNGGGADDLAETVIGRFITHKVLASVGFQRKPGTDLYEKLVFVVKPRGPWCYEGKVAVLTNEGCASACEHFVSGMFEAGAILVGTPTTGACGWSNGIDLPAGVTLRCSLTFPLHGKVPSPLHGIEPHYLVAPTIEDIRTGRDTVLEKAMEILQ